MGKHTLGRFAAVVVSFAAFAVSLVLNGLAVVGVSESDLCSSPLRSAQFL